MRSKRLQREVDDLVAQGWRIEDEDRDRVVMVDREYGSLASHLLVAVLTAWWTMGIGNVLWALYNYVSNSRRRVLWEDAAERSSTSPPSHAQEDAGRRGASSEPSVATAPEDAVDCPNCGADVSPGAAYCHSCGTDLDRSPATEDAIVCPKCEGVVVEGARYCRSCGANLSDALSEG